MKHYIYLIAIACFIAVGCSKNNPVAPADAANHMDDPMSAVTGSTSDAIFDIPAPVMGTVVNTTITTVGGTGNINVNWTYQTPANTYYTATYYKPQGANKPNRPYGLVPTSLNPTTGVTLTPALNSPYEFWGGSQKSIVSSPSYTGHYDVERSTDGGATWTEIAETRSTTYTDNNGGAGWHVGDVVSYRIKEKSNEKKSGTQANDATHHSNYSGTGTLTVCGPVTGPDQFDNHCAVSAAGGNGTWAECTWTSATCKNALNVNFNILQHHTIRNTCSDAITADGDSYNYSGNMCASIDGGNTWISATWSGDHYEVSLPNAGPGNYTVNYSTDCTPSGAISATTAIVVPSCTLTGEGCIEETISDDYSGNPVGAYGDNVHWGVWNDPTFTENGEGPDFRCQNANENINPHWKIFVHHRTQNSCTHEITITGTDEVVSDIYFTIDNGTTWHPCHWQSGKYHIDGNLDNPGSGIYHGYFVLAPATDGDPVSAHTVVAQSWVVVP